MSVTLKDVGFGDVTDPEVKKALEDALKASTVTGGRRGGGPKDSRKATRSDPPGDAAVAAARVVSGDAVKNPGKLKAAVDTAVRLATGTAAAGAVGMVAVNRPDVLAQLAEVIAVSLSEIANIAVTSTYSDWGKAILSIGRGIGVISQTGALQAGQGPVVPFAIATAIMTWRAQSQGKTFMQQIKDDASGAAGAVASAASAAVKAVRPDPMEALFELADRARQIKLAGAGAEDLKELVTRDLRGVPAARGGPAGISVVPAAAPRDPGKPLKAIAALAAPPGMGEVTRRGSEVIAAEARARRAAGDEVMAPPPMGKQTGKRTERLDDEEEDEGAGVFPPGAKKSRSLGGRRKTKKSKSKRRVTRRKAPMAVKFVY